MLFWIFSNSRILALFHILYLVIVCRASVVPAVRLCKRLSNSMLITPWCISLSKY